MKTYNIYCNMVQPLVGIVRAKNKEEALESMEKLLENGEMTEESIGWMTEKEAIETRI